MPIRSIDPAAFPWLDPSKYSFSLGIEAADTTWVAGQTAAAYDDNLGRVTIAGDGGAQAEVCWAKVDSVLHAAGRSRHDCTEIIEYVTADGLSQRDAIAAHRPEGTSVSTMVVDSLVRPTAFIEVEAVGGSPSGLVKLPQILPVDDEGNAVAPGDVVAQVAWVLEEAGRRLAELGLGYEHVVKVVQQSLTSTRRQLGEAGEARRALLGPAYPSSTGLLVSALPHPDALVALDVWASSEPKSVVPYAASAYEPLTFSPAVEAGGLLFISGTTAWDPDTNGTIAPGDIAGQAEYIYDQIARICETAGTSTEHLVKTVEYVSPEGLDRYREVGPLRERMLSTPYPVSTGVVVNALLSRKWVLEVEAVAVME